jgi:hypothetical protein
MHFIGLRIHRLVREVHPQPHNGHLFLFFFKTNIDIGRGVEVLVKIEKVVILDDIFNCGRCVAMLWNAGDIVPVLYGFLGKIIALLAGVF